MPGSVAPAPRRHSDAARPPSGSCRAGDLGPFQRWFRNWFSRHLALVLIKGWFRVQVEHPERFLDEPCVYAFNHLSWMDPVLLLRDVPEGATAVLLRPEAGEPAEGRPQQVHVVDGRSRCRSARSRTT